MRIDVEIPEMHKTRKILLETVIQEISTRETSAISSEEILEMTGISRGSLYHHFTDYSDLVETAQLLIVKRYITSTSVSALTAIRDNEDAHRAIEEIMGIVASADSISIIQPSFSARVRTLRLELFVAALTRPKLRDEVQAFQDTLSTTWVEAIELCKQRGWANADLDPQSTSILIQSTFFGRTLDDYTSKKMAITAWTSAIQQLLRSLLFSKVVD